MEIKNYSYDKSRRCTCTLLITEECNLNCTYCYEHNKKRSLLSLDTAKNAIIETFEKAVSKNVEFVEILFHGGEPFMAFNLIKEICEWLWRNKWQKKYICYATTNGTLIQGEIKKWVIEIKAGLH
ncbi:MAG: 4Fe-4S cluster-binding domain-containing protein [Rikenellaceae bacterium]|nr:4Fe-4S cluster-binding domain-containing protein [Rikenellaceae bacterium]